MPDVTLDPRKIRPLKGSDVSPGVAGYAGQIGDIVYNDNNNEAQLAPSTHTGLVGMIVGVGNLHRTDGLFFTGNGLTILWHGRVALNTGTLDPTQQYYIGANPGKLADAADVTVRSVGAPETTNIFNFNGHKIE